MTSLPPPPETAAPSLQQFTDLAELAGGFIHEIKNHLGTLSLNLQLLAEDFEAPQTQRERRAFERVTRLGGECQRILDLSNDFLRFARIEELHIERTTLDEVVNRMIDFLTPTARARGIELNWFSAVDLPPICLDRELFEQALLNLMLNAEQAMPEGGTLTFIGRRLGNAGEAVGVGGMMGEAAKDWVCLEVIDSGLGMPPDILEKIFRPFHTTKQNGNGLGLPTARKIVLAHGGRIEVQSEVGRGTKFTIVLPTA